MKPMHAMYEVGSTLDPGTVYSVITPSGIRFTQCKPAATEGSALQFAYLAEEHSDTSPKPTWRLR